MLKLRQHGDSNIKPFKDILLSFKVLSIWNSPYDNSINSVAFVMKLNILLFISSWILSISTYDFS